MEHRKLPLTPLDHLMPRRYAIKLLYFPLSNPDVASVAAKLRSSLQRLLETIPILSGTVLPDHQSEQSGSLCVAAPWNTVDEVFRVKDLTADLDYEHLRRSHFPMSITERYDLLSIRMSRPDPRGLENPVMMAQVNFIRHGMILVQFLHHSFMDGLGGAAVMELWAGFCRGEDRADTVGDGGMVSDGIMDRTRLMLGNEAGRWENIREYVAGSEIYDSTKRLGGDVGSRAGVLSRGYSMAKYAFNVLANFTQNRLSHFLLSAIGPRGTSSSAPQPPKEVDTEVFFFPRSKLLTLKSVMSTYIASAVPSPVDSKTSPSPYISTNDVLSALVFTCVTEARKPFNPTDIPQAIPFAISVSGRRLMNPPLPEKYVGNMSLFCHLDLPLNSVSVESHNIAAIAYQARRRLLQLDDDYIQRLIGALRTVDDTSKVAPACRASKEWQFMITPWTTQGYYGMDWGSEIGVKCERVRIPKVSRPAFDGVNIVFPELKVGNAIGEEEAGLEVMVGLEKRAMERLKGMEEWSRWAQWRCS